MGVAWERASQINVFSRQEEDDNAMDDYLHFELYKGANITWLEQATLTHGRQHERPRPLA